MKYLTVREVREQLGVSRTTVERWIKKGHLKKVKVGHAVRIPAESVEALEDSNTVVLPHKFEEQLRRGHEEASS